MSNEQKPTPEVQARMDQLKKDIQEKNTLVQTNPKPVFDVPDGPKSYISDVAKELMEMGAAGKLWTLECEYVMDSEWKLLRWRNLTDKDCMERRLKMFQVGFSIPVHGEPGHWRIICPNDIKKVFLHRQSGYFQ